MRFLVRLKHWQLFLFTWGAPIAISIFSFTHPPLVIEMFPVMMLLFTLGSLGWIWAIAIELHPKLPVGVPLNITVFKYFFSIPILYIVAITVWLTYLYQAGDSPVLTTGIIIGIIVVLHLISMICFVMGIRFAAKTLKSVELNRHARFNDYIGEFFLIWFSIFGVWIIQPRLNKLTS